MTVRALAAALALSGCLVEPDPGWAPDFAGCSRIELRVDGTGPPIAGAEDIAVDPAVPVAYLSAYDRRAVADALARRAASLPEGGLYRLDLTTLGADRVAVEDLTADFRNVDEMRPHGIDLWPDDGPATHLFVVNRRYVGDGTAGRVRQAELLRFAIGADGLSLDGRIRHPGLCRANDVVALGPDRALVSRDHGACAAGPRTLERVLGLTAAQVVEVRFAPTPQLDVVVDDLFFANGLARLPDGRVAVAETRGRRLAVLAPGDGTVERRLTLPAGPDNLSAAADGTVLAALHPRLLALAAYLADWPGIDHVPSWVVAVDPLDGRTRTLFRDPVGRMLSAATVAAPFDGGLLIGTVQDRAIVLCRTTP